MLFVTVPTEGAHSQLGNTILVKLKLWELVIVFNKTFWSATNLCLRYASAKCAGNLPFRGIVFCNLGTSKTVISKFVTTANIVTPYLSPYGHPNNVSMGQKSTTKKARKKRQGRKKVGVNNELIPF